ncbi:hypothetical protein B1R32_10224 [Abditibacterium utsteinense]|uniref:Dolichyl-phosphate-mannose-protein mannosyltransferase n=1 Tax=Abditibacterium utsteinense TaxID=1960156 RepID=A0A2S8SW57_9BACT|nr:hypothetical protein [Abditibacterium utsteinense]PQV65017.1 hypothetical protein B1R32_10224 [Abditibacterium utsteinense]
MRRVLASLPLFFALAFWLLIGRGSFGVRGEWILTPNARPWPLGAWLLPLGVLFIFCGAAALSAYDRFRRAKSEKEKRNSTLMALFFLAIVLFLWPWSLLGPGDISQSTSTGKKPQLTLEGRFNIVAAQWSDVATEYFGAAYQINNARDFGREYATKWQKPVSRYQAHVATHPPGAVLFFYGARRIYETLPPLQSAFESLAVALAHQPIKDMAEGANVLRISASRGAGAGEVPPLPLSAVGGALWSAFLLGFSLVAAIPAVYGIAKSGQSGDEAEKRGLFAVALWTLAPSTNLFAFTLDAPIAAGSVWTLFLISRALDASDSKRARIYSLGAGILLALTSFVSIGALAIGAVIALMLFLWRREQFFSRGLQIGFAFAATWAILSVAFAFNPFLVVLNAMEVHRFATLSSRSWLLWAPMNLIMWAPFVGFGLLVCIFRREKPRISGAQLGISTLFILILLSISGNVRGEVERLWLFALAPIAVWAAFAPISTKNRAILLGVQALQTLLMAATLGPLVRP